MAVGSLHFGTKKCLHVNEPPIMTRSPGRSLPPMTTKPNKYETSRQEKRVNAPNLRQAHNERIALLNFLDGGGPAVVEACAARAKAIALAEARAEHQRKMEEQMDEKMRRQTNSEFRSGICQIIVHRQKQVQPLEIELPSTMMVDDLMAGIYDLSGVIPEDQRIFFGCRRLPPGQSLAACGFTQGRYELHLRPELSHRKLGALEPMLARRGLIMAISGETPREWRPGEVNRIEAEDIRSFFGEEADGVDRGPPERLAIAA
eukprot:TRINITY_DN29170_c1_g2_i1.p1 TRINITY_DN29170_c1_g2~~TRINITY_DN29170_c1_g2_i1.p1  ORF type:complete len:260 (-),score=38.84 TRINITY_DN29170_c1_g2_i1:427-1206(-)